MAAKTGRNSDLPDDPGQGLAAAWTLQAKFPWLVFEKPKYQHKIPDGNAENYDTIKDMDPYRRRLGIHNFGEQDAYGQESK